MKITKVTTIERDEPTWDLIKEQLTEGLEKIAIDRRAAIEIGIPVKEIDEYISINGESIFRKIENMSSVQMKTFLLSKIIGEITDPEELVRFLEDVTEGDED